MKHQAEFTLSIMHELQAESDPQAALAKRVRNIVERMLKFYMRGDHRSHSSIRPQRSPVQLLVRGTARGGEQTPWIADKEQLKVCRHGRRTYSKPAVLLVQATVAGRPGLGADLTGAHWQLCRHFQLGDGENKPGRSISGMWTHCCTKVPATRDQDCTERGSLTRHSSLGSTR